MDEHLLPSIFDYDDAGCSRSLVALALLGAGMLVPGRVPLWEGLIRDAVEQALV